MQEFVKALKKRVIQKGLQDSNGAYPFHRTPPLVLISWPVLWPVCCDMCVWLEREKVADAKPGDRAQFQFILSFEDQSQAFEVYPLHHHTMWSCQPGGVQCEEDQIARAQGVVIDLMREYQASVKKAKDSGEQGVSSPFCPAPESSAFSVMKHMPKSDVPGL